MIFKLDLVGQYLPLNTWFQEARAAFIAGDYSTALNHFSGIESAFGLEAEYLEPEFHKIVVSMHGMSALMSGNYSGADDRLSLYMQKYYRKTPEDSLILLGLIQASKRVNQYDLGLYERFISDYPRHRDVSLIHYEKILRLLNVGDLKDVCQEMLSFDQSAASESLKNRVVLAVVQKAVSEKQFPLAVQLLESKDWSVSSMPELAGLAMSALQVADSLMTDQNYEQAVSVFKLVPFYAELLEQQENRVVILREQMQKWKQSSQQISFIQEQHYVQLLTKLNGQLIELQQAVDYTPVFLLKYGRCLLHLEKYVEAWSVFRSLAYLDATNPIVKEQAWYHWILCSHGSKNWDEAIELCRSFSESFPDSELLPRSLYLLSRTFQEMSEFHRANEVLTHLIEEYPNNEDVPTWLMTRGFNASSLNYSNDAIRDFERVIGYPNAPESMLVRARYWNAVVMSDSGRSDEAVAIIEDLIVSNRDHWMFPDFVYRLGAIHYSARDYGKAENSIRLFLESYPDHTRSVEASVLLGDILMGQGRLDEASMQFKKVDSNSAQKYVYSIFQIGKILKAQEKWEEMELFFLDYLENCCSAQISRIGEAYYWIGWCLAKRGRPQDAVPLYLNAVKRFGNDVQGQDIQQILLQLKALKSDCSPTDFRELNRDVQGYLKASSFEEWLDAQMTHASESELKTYYGRLLLCEAFQVRASGDKEIAAGQIINIGTKIGMDDMDDLMLGEVGVCMLEQEFGLGGRFVKRLLVRSPDSIHKGYAYYGMALFEQLEKNPEQAINWLQLFEKETPGHIKSVSAKLLLGKLFVAVGSSQEAIGCFNEVLRLKHARGLPHVRALVGLAETYTSIGAKEKAIPYWQRVYTLYRAYRDEVAEAYLRSSILFHELGLDAVAIKTCDEMIRQEDLVLFPQYSEAVKLRDKLNATKTSDTIHIPVT